MANKWTLWVVVMMAVGMIFLSSCSGKDSNPAKEQKQTLTDHRKALKEVTDFIDKQGAGEKAK